jgi:phage tail sheath protein FI
MAGEGMRGVRVRALSMASHAIDGVSTSVAGFVGVTKKGPAKAGKPLLVESFARFEKVFGGYLPHDVNGVNALAYAVHGYFANGGTKLYIKRVVAASGKTPRVTEFVGKDNGKGRRTGVHALKDIGEISVVAAPGITSPSVQKALIRQCETLKNRFAILDPAPGPKGAPSTLGGVRDQRLALETKFAALYYPRLMVADAITGSPIPVPPSGHLAGVFARVDALRGVWKAPIGETIIGISGLETRVTDQDQSVLDASPVNINAIRQFAGKGVLVFGARVITSDNEWKYVNVRRFVTFLEQSIENGTRWVVLEPNVESLWAQVRLEVSSFLFNLWKAGALQGVKPEEAFFVKCDHTTMTQNDLDNGRLIVLVGVALLKPAEFALFRIGQWKGGSSIEP